MTTWMIYGANGYTGTLAAERAAAAGLRPVLAGRSADRVRAVAEALALEWRAFDLAAAADHLDDVDVVLHCAGPFSTTAVPMIDACLATSTSYLDITGEIEVFEAGYARHDQAVATGVSIISGVGFDVVPTDCLAATLAAALPTATSLELAFAGTGGVSPGTARTSVESLPGGGRVRRGGVIVVEPVARQRRRVRFSDRERWCMSIPWGDVASAHRSTGIGDIVVYTAAPRGVGLAARALAPLMGQLARPGIQRRLEQLIDAKVAGPDEKVRAKAHMHLWGRVADDAGRAVEATMDTPEGYDLTVTASLAATEHVVAGDVPPGAWTPSQAFGSGFAASLPGVTQSIPGA